MNPNLMKLYQRNYLIMTKKTKGDPTGQNSNRRKARKAVSNKLLRIRKKVKNLFKGISTYKKNIPSIKLNKETYYEYDLYPGDVDRIRSDIQSIINFELGAGRDIPPLDWFYSEFAEQPYREASAEQVVHHNKSMEAAIIAGVISTLVFRKREPSEILRSTKYYQGVQSVLARNYALVSSLSKDMSTRTVRILLDGMASGERPSEILSSIDKSFDTADSKAARIINTEVNRSYNDGIVETATLLAQDVGLTPGVQHISALLPTTRPDHSARHLKYYTVQDQQQWWNTGSNRINCYCRVNAVLLDEDGRPINRES